MNLIYITSNSSWGLTILNYFTNNHFKYGHIHSFFTLVFCISRKCKTFHVLSHSIRLYMNHINDTIFSNQNCEICEKITEYYCQLFNIYIVKQLSYIKCFSTFYLNFTSLSFNVKTVALRSASVNCESCLVFYLIAFIRLYCGKWTGSEERMR